VSVLDASALLAYLRDEPGAEAVEVAVGEDAIIGAVNLAEVLSKLVDAGQDAVDAMTRIEILPMRIVPFDGAAAVETARLRSLRSQAGLSIGDRACLALARQRRLAVLTADAVWAGLLDDVDVALIR